MNVFPINVHHEGAGAFRPTFISVKPKDLTWFECDVIIHSRTLVEFVVYDLDHRDWSRGEEIRRIRTAVPFSLTAPTVKKRIRRLAEARRAKELHEAEEQIINRYVAEIVDDLILGKVA